VIIVKIHGFQDLASKLETDNHSTTNNPEIITIHLKFLSYGIIPYMNMFRTTLIYYMQDAKM
jgi:hypothetical protein